VEAKQAYIKGLSDVVHQAEGLQLKKKAKGKQSTFDPKKPKKLWIYVATEFPAWQQKYIDALQESYNEVPPRSPLIQKSNSVDDAGLKKKVASLGAAAEVKQAMVFVQEMKRSLLNREKGTPTSAIFDRTLIFDEFETLDAAVPYIKRSAGLAEVVVVELSVGDGGGFEGKTKHGDKVEMLVPVDKTIPGQPSLAFENI
jgi:leucyl-tRNA synthetase